MKKLLLICLTIATIFLQSCDERITPTNEITAGGNPATNLIARKWVYEEIIFDIDGKKTIVYGNNKTPSITADFFNSPNDYFLFSKNGDLETYTEDKKETVKGTWKFLNNEKQVELSDESLKYTYDIDKLSDKSLELSFSIALENLDNETLDRQAIIAIAFFGDLIQETSKKVKYTMRLVAN
jgi:hypothetical protein